MKKIFAAWMRIAVLFALVFVGCERTVEVLEDQIRTSASTEVGVLGKGTVSASEINEALEVMAIYVADALRSRELRARLKDEVGKKFTGDYEVLVKNFVSQQLPDGSTLLEKLADAHMKIRSRAGDNVGKMAARTAVKSIVSRIPKFHIAIPVNFDKWDVDTYIPLVAYHPVGIDDIKIERVKGFDAEGKLHWLSAKVPPAEPVVVLGVNERTDMEGNLTIQAAPIDDGGGGGGGGSYGSRLVLGQFNCKNNNWDGWFGGAPEFYTAVTRACGLENPTHTNFNDVTEVRNYILHRTVYSMLGFPPDGYVCEVRIMEEDGGLFGGDDLVDRWQGLYVPGFEVWFYGANADITLYWQTF